MAEDPDTYAAQRAGLRDTAKWYSGALAALGAGVAGGLSFGVLPDLGAEHLLTGVLVGALVFATILVAVLLMQGILFTAPFGATELATPSVQALIAPHLRTLLPADAQTVAELQQKLDAATGADRTRLRTALQKVESFAAYVDLRQKILRTNAVILVLFVVASLGIGYLSYLKGMALKAANPPPEAVTLLIGKDWAGLAPALAAACPAGERLAVLGRADQPYDGWWTVTVKGPAACAGATLTVPAALVER
jgi:hypothetical protein